MKYPIILIGAGGHCVSCIESIESSGIWQIAGIIDANKKCGEYILGYQIIGTDKELPSLAEKYKNALITVGQIKSASIRIRLFTKAIESGFSLPTIIAQSAIVSHSSQLGFGTIAMHHVLVNAGASVGENCIINSGAIIEHDVIVGSNTHVSTGAIVNGGCHVGSRCLIGSGAVLRNGIEVSDDIVIGAGTVVVANLTEPGIYVGCPARKIK
jgi:sugar O-acyltransferase (sialic acid O-acetyltransferase NeuD family)